MSDKDNKSREKHAIVGASEFTGDLARKLVELSDDMDDIEEDEDE